MSKLLTPAAGRKFTERHRNRPKRGLESTRVHISLYRLFAAFPILPTNEMYETLIQMETDRRGRIAAE